MVAAKKLKIFFHPLEASGHVNACIGLAQTMANRGHDIYFLVDSSFSGQLSKYDYIKEILLESSHKPQTVNGENPIKTVAKHVQSCGMFSNLDPIEKIQRTFNNPFLVEKAKMMVDYNPQVERLMENEKPDLIVVDNFIFEPAILYSTKIPWITVFSCSPLMVHNSPKLPPFCSGFPTEGGDQSKWDEFRKVIDMMNNDHIISPQNTLCRQCNYPKLPPDQKGFIISKYMNIYGYPEELDYHRIVPIPDTFIRVDAFCRQATEQFQLPEEFKQKMKAGDKLIYLSMGSMGGVNLDLMHKLIRILANTPHKYIISKGPLHDEIELADNMWGEAMLPQTALLPLMDLVITHGGNNTVTETFCFGKPMIVMPLFCDQYDNAQRIEELGYGIRINPFDFDDKQMITAIDKLLNNQELKQRLDKIAKRIEFSNSKEKACKQIEAMVEKHQKNLRNE